MSLTLLNLHNKPGLYIACFAADGLSSGFGTGKTLTMIETALNFAERRKLKIATNLQLSQNKIREFARYRGLHFISNIARIYTGVELHKIGAFDNTLFLFDELGALLFSRDYKRNGNREFWKNLFTLRHRQCWLFYTCQDIKQVDLQLRDRTDYFIICKGVLEYDSDKRHDILTSRHQSGFYRAQLDFMRERHGWSPLRALWASRGNFAFSTRFLSALEAGILNMRFSDFKYKTVDDLLFQCFPSIARRGKITPVNNFCNISERPSNYSEFYADDSRDSGFRFN